jgi:hypothetical protein
MGHHTSKPRQPLNATTKVLLFGGAALIGFYGWYTESSQQRPQPVADARTQQTPGGNANDPAGAVNSNPWGSPAPPPSPSDAVAVTPQPVPGIETPGTAPATATPAVEPVPAPKVVHDNAWREKLWASLPQPQAPTPPPLEPLSELAVRNLRREIAQEVLKKAGARSIQRIHVTLGTPAKYVMCGRQYREFLTAPRKHSKEIYYLVGQHLFLADAMFAQQDPQVQLSGIGIANEVISVLAQDMKDGPLAARVADAYLIPHLDLAPLKMYAVLNRRFLMIYAIRAYSFGERYDMLERVCGHAINLYGSDRNSTDALRITLAKALQKQHKWDAAIQVLNDIQDPGLTGLRDDQLPKYIQERDASLASQKSKTHSK